MAEGLQTGIIITAVTPAQTRARAGSVRSGELRADANLCGHDTSEGREGA